MSANERIRPYNFTVPLAVADTEYELFAVATATYWKGGAVPVTSLVGIMGLSFQLRANVDLRFAFETGMVAAAAVDTPCLTLKAGAVFNAPEKLCWTDVTTIYFAADSGTDNIVEGLLWLQA